jgi:hypothetical protein
MQFPGPDTSKGHEMHCIGTGKTCDTWCFFWAIRDQRPGCLRVIAADILWLFSIAMGNGPFIDGLRI